MPTYFQGSLASQIGSAGLTNPYSLPSSSGNGTRNPADNCCCPSSTLFLSNLTNKLAEMTQALKQQFADLQANCHATGTKATGPIFAQIQVAGTIKPKYEYLIYLQRYGPPINGVFDPIYLDLIRAELAANP